MARARSANESRPDGAAGDTAGPARVPSEAAALAHPSRERLALALAERPEGMTAFELAEAIGLHHSAIRQHLAVLARAGVVTSERETVSGRPGRPSIRYRLASLDSVAAAGHRELVRLLLRLVRRAGASEADVEEAGREEGRLLGEAGGGASEVVRAFARLGFAPEEVTDAAARRRGEMDLRLRHCPFKEAVLAPGGELVCALHRGLTLGLLDRAAEDGYLATFEPKDPREAGCRVVARGLGPR
jgi:predicted ArsR family transcriptional regulator